MPAWLDNKAHLTSNSFCSLLFHFPSSLSLVLRATIHFPATYLVHPLHSIPVRCRIYLWTSFAYTLTFLLFFFFLRYRLPIGWVLETFHNAFERSYKTSETRACNRSTTLLSSLFETMPDARIYMNINTFGQLIFPFFLHRRNRQKWRTNSTIWRTNKW